MADSIILSDGTNNYEFVYDSSTQNDFKVHYGVRAEAGEPDPLWHRPDGSPPKLIRLKNQPRTIFLTQNVYGDDWDDVINTLAPIKRLVDGEDQQAARYHTHGDVSKVYLRIQLDGMTSYTDATVIYGDVDDSGSFYTPAAILNKRALGVVLMLVVEPLGEGAAITLRNDLASSPHFIEANTSATLADGWNDQGTPTRSIASTIYLIGGKTQRVETDNSTTEGISSDTVAAGSGVNFVAYVWVYVQSGNTVTVQIRNGAATVLASKTVTTAGGANYDKSAPARGSAAGGGTFYRLSFASTTVNTNGVQLYIIRASGDASATTVFFVDGAYVQLNTTTIPDAFASTAAIQNRYDVSSGNEARINYLDVWGVPGDSSALVQHAITGTSITNSKDFIIVAKQTDGAGLATNALHWVDNTSMTLAILSGSQATTADANRAGGSYLRHTADATTVADATLLVTVGTAAQFYAFAQMPHRVYVIARSSSTSTLLEIDASRFASVGGSATIQTANTWLLMDLGYITAGSSVLVNTAGATGSLQIGITPGATSATVDIDAVLLLPCNDDGFCIGTHDTSTYATSTVDYFFGQYGTFFGGGDFQESPFIGSIWTLPAGNIMTRYIYTVGFTLTGAHTLTDTSSVTLTIYPRTRHLLGTS